MKDAVLAEELPKIWAEIDGAVFTGMIHKLTVFAIFNEHINVKKNNNTEYQSARALDMAVEALEQEPVLDMELQEIKEEIEQEMSNTDSDEYLSGLSMALMIINEKHINAKGNNSTEYQSARALDISSVEVACKTWMSEKENA